MAVGADQPEPDDVEEPARTGFRPAVAAWVPMALFVLVATFTKSAATCDGIWGCDDQSTLVFGLLLVPASGLTLGFAWWAYSRARSALEISPDSERASIARFLARFSVVAVAVAWIWLVFWHAPRT